MPPFLIFFKRTASFYSEGFQALRKSISSYFSLHEHFESVYWDCVQQKKLKSTKYLVSKYMHIAYCFLPKQLKGEREFVFCIKGWRVHYTCLMCFLRFCFRENLLSQLNGFFPSWTTSYICHFHTYLFHFSILPWTSGHRFLVSWW